MIISLRLGGKQHMNHEYIDELVKSISKYKGCVDEVWIATSYGLLSIEQCRKNAHNMSLAARKFEEIDVIPSMQLSRTIGHGIGNILLKNYGDEGIKDLSVNELVGINGEVRTGRFCWTNQTFRKYIYDTVKEYAAFKPQTVWVDDDLRILHGKSNQLCFCDYCIDLFNKEYNYSYTREQLKNDFLNNIGIREKYIEFNIKNLAKLASIISRAVYEVSPESCMALQNGGKTPLAINVQKACLDAMIKPSDKAPKFRAGGGFYNDNNPNGMIEKGLIINYMISRLPEYVVDRACEIENLPFVAYGKSPEGTCLEASVYIAYGCNMASFSMNMYKNEDMIWYERIFRKFCEYKTYWEAVIKHNKNTSVGGVSVYQSNKTYLRKINESEALDLDDSCILEVNNLLRCGIPFHTSPTGNAYILTSKSCDFVCEEDIDFLINQPVITDAKTIEKLLNMGYGDKIDIEVKKIPYNYHFTTYEKPTEHVINKSNKMKSWSNSPYCDRDEPYYISGKNAEYITELFTILENKRLGNSMAVVTTSKNKKWLVMSAHLSDSKISFNRRNQILSALNYISNNTIPAYVNSPEQIVIIPRINDKGETISVTLVNVSISDCESFEVVIRNPKNNEKYTIVAPNENPVQCLFNKKGNEYIAEVSSLRGWRVKTILL